MPSGNQTTRPNNRNERGAAKRTAIRNRSFKELKKKGAEARESGDLLSEKDLAKLRGKLNLGRDTMADDEILKKRDRKQTLRKVFKYDDRPGNTVQGKAKGGTVSSSPRPKARPDYSKRPKLRPEEIDMSPSAERDERKQVMGKKSGGSMKKMAGGGYVKKSPDGLAVRGKTRLKMKGCGKTG